MSQQAPILLQLFGQPELRGVTGRVITRFAGGKSLHLLAILAISAGQDFRRVDLIAELWPGVSHEDGRNRLNVALHHVRKSLMALIGTRADRALLSSRGCLRLEAGLIDVDIVRFEVTAQQLLLQPVEVVNRAQIATLLEQSRTGVMLGYADDWALAWGARINTLVERLRILVDNTLPSSPPMQASGATPQSENGIRHQVTSGDFVNAGTATTDVLDWLSAGQTRVLGVHGPAGVGKSRVTRVALDTQSDYRVINIPCDGLTDEAMLGAAVSLVLDTPLPGSISGRTTISNSVQSSGKPLLVVFDNADTILTAVSNYASRFIGTLPSARVIITSREAITGNLISNIRVYPLQVDGTSMTPLGMRLSPALQLFEKAAHRVAAGFEITSENVDTVTRLCLFADGIPHAIELIASKMQAYSPEMLMELLTTEGIELGAGIDARTHVNAMESLLTWSIQSLPATTQRFLLQCTVFPASFDAEAAAVVTGREDASKLLHDLVNASLVYLVQKETLFDGLRYRLLESVRRQCQRLLESAAQQSLLTKHAEYFVAVADSIPPAGIGRADFIRLNRFRLDDENFTQAIETLYGRDSLAAAALVLSLAPLWLQTHAHQLRGQLSKLLTDQERLSDQQRVWLYVYLASEAESRFDYETATELHKKVHTLVGMTRKAYWLASPIMVDILLRDPAMAEWLQGMVDTWPEPMTAAVILRHNALHAWYAGDLTRAAQLLDQAVRCAQDSTPAVVRDTLCIKAQFCIWTLETVEAREALEAVVRFYATSGLANSDHYVWQPLSLLASTMITTGRFEEARDLALRAWSTIEGLPSGPGMAAPLLALATAEALLGNQAASDHWCQTLRQRHSEFLRSSNAERTQWNLTDSHPALADIALANGNVNEAVGLAASGWRHFSSIQPLTVGPQMMGYVTARGTLSKAEHVCGLIDSAIEGIVSTLPLRAKYGIYRDVLAELDIVAAFAVGRGDLQQAARIYGGTYAIRLRSLHVARPHLHALHVESRDVSKNAHPGEWSKGTTLMLGQLIEDAMKYLASR